MIFDELEINNAFVYDHVRLPLTETGLSLIHGPNGGGKSLLFDLLASVCIPKFDKSVRTREVNLKDMYSYGSGHASIMVRLHHEQTKIGIGYKRSAKSGIYEFEGIDTPKGGMPEAKRLIGGIVPWTWKEFYSFVVVNSVSAFTIIDSSSTDRIRLLGDIFQLDLYEKAIHSIKSESSIINATIKDSKDIEIELGSIRKQATKKPIKPISSIKKLRHKINKLQDQYDALFDIMQKIGNVNWSTVRKLSKLSITELQNKLHQKEELLSNLTLLRPYFGASVWQISNIKTVLNYIKKYEQNNDLRQQQQEIEQDISQIEKRIRSIEISVDADEINNDIRVLAKRIGKLEHEIDNYTSIIQHSECPICGTPIKRGVFLAKVKVKKKRLHSLTKTNAVLEEQHTLALQKEQYQYKLKTLQKQLKQLSIHKLDKKVRLIAKKYLSQKDVIQSLVYTLQDNTIKWSTAQELHKQYPSIKDSISKLTNLVQAYRVIINNYDNIQQVEHVLDISATVATLRKKINKLQDRLNDAIEEWSTYEANQQAYMQATQLLQTMKQKVDTLGANKQYREALQDSANIISKLKRNTVAQISQELASTLEAITAPLFRPPIPHFRIEAGPRDFFIIMEQKGKSRDVSVLSAGEKRRVAVGLTIALAYQAPSTKRTNLLVLDEIDNGLDTDGQHRLVEIFPTLRAKFNSVYILTHSQILKEEGNFDAVWNMTPGKKFSTLTREN